MTDIEVRKGRELAAIERLPGEQRTAMESLLLGKSVAEAARSTGVARSTIYHWLKNDSGFQAAYNQWHGEMQESCRSRLMKMTDLAATALEKSLEAGDAKAAMQLLKGMGLIGKREVGSGDPAELDRVAETEKKKRKAELDWAEKTLDW